MMPEYQYKQQAKITQTRTVNFTVTANTPEEADQVAEALSRKLVWKEHEADYPGLFVDSNIFYENDELIDPEPGKPSIETLCSGEADDYNMPEITIHSNEADAILPDHNEQTMKILFGEAAVSFYENEGHLPSDEDMAAMGAELIEVKYRTEREKEIYFQALENGSGWQNYVEIKK